MLHYFNRIIKNKKYSVFNYVVYGVPIFWLAIFLFVPLLIIFSYSFSENQGILEIKTTWNWVNYQKSFNLVYLKIFLKSLFFAFSTTFICLVLGVLISLYLISLNKYAKIFLLFLLTLPFWTNMLIRTYALIAIFRERGYVNFFLEKIWNGMTYVISQLGVNTEDWLFTPWQILYTDGGVVLGLVYVYLPFMVFPIFSALDRLDFSYVEASFDLGAGYVKTLFLVVLPFIHKGIKNGIVITFVPVLGSFLVPDLLGGKDSSMIANLIERQFKSANDWPLGAALSLFLIYLTFIIIFFSVVIKIKRNKH